jgi:hypothetical protein
MVKNPKPDLWAGFSLRESLVAGFCATFIVVSNLFLRIPLHLPGHRVLPLAFFLLLGRACLRPAWSATSIGLISGVLALSLGREEPMHLLKYLAAGGIADLTSLVLPAVTSSFIMGALAGALVGSSWFPLSLLTDYLAGMDAELAFRHTLVKLGSAIVFGAVGGALVPAVACRLRGTGLLPAQVPPPMN